MRFTAQITLMSVLFAGLANANAQSVTPEPPQAQTAPVKPAGQDASSSQAGPDAASSQQQTAPAESQPSRDPNQPVLKHRPARKRTHKAPVKSSEKVVVRNGGAKEGAPELAPGTSKEKARHDRENTNELLATTNANLKRVEGRQLTPAQAGMAEQIRTYISQSKAAVSAGDLDRAHTLAYKAHLLSDELAKK